MNPNAAKVGGLQSQGAKGAAGVNLLQVTISIGATLAMKDDSRDALIHRTDKLMHGGKKSGNCLTIG